MIHAIAEGKPREGRLHSGTLDLGMDDEPTEGPPRSGSMDLGIASFDDTTLDAKARREDIRDYLRVVFGTLWNTIYVRVWFDDECEYCGKRETEPESCDCLDDNSTTQTKVN